MNADVSPAMGAALEGARRATADAAPIAPPDPEVAATARRRQFTSAERTRILNAADACKAPGEDMAVTNLTHQREFFSTHLQPWVLMMCGDIQKHPRARFYAALAELTRAFMGVETQGFDMLA